MTTCDRCGVELVIGRWLCSAAGLVLVLMVVAMWAGACSPVGGLLLGRGPANITWFVVPVVVDPVEAMTSRRARANVSVETCEGFRPWAVDMNPTASIRRPALILTPGKHSDPDAVSGRLAHAVSLGSSVSLAETFCADASATVSGTLAKVDAVNDLCSSTIATAQVPRSPVSLICEFDHGEASESRPGWHWREGAFNGHV